MSRQHSSFAAAASLAAMAFVAMTLAVPAPAQQAPQAEGDPREAVVLSPVETAKLLAGMRTYLETIQSLVTAMAENKVDLVPDIAKRSGAKLLQGVDPVTGIKLPLPFASMSFDTHDKFDKLADKAQRGTSRAEVLNDLRDIMGNCITCHASYRLAP
jgi:hypothetical protein